MKIQRKEFLKDLDSFFEERDWKQFHSPKNLIMDLCSEIGELCDHFRWLTEEESYTPPNKGAIEDEVGDIYMMLVYLSEKLGIDPEAAARQKLKKLGEKYPSALCRGRRDKYHAYKNPESNRTDLEETSRRQTQ